MVSCLIYPNYTNFYYYEKGDSFIKLVRRNAAFGGKIIYTNNLYFDTPEKAENYFNNNCGE